MKIEAIIFDYGNVLSLPQSESCFRELADRCSMTVDELSTHYWDLRPDYDAGHLSGSDYWHEIARRCGREMTGELARVLIELDNKSWSLENKPMSDFARLARRSGMKTAILSNMPLDFRNYLPVGVTWLPEFDHHTYSCEIRQIKPARAIYEHCISGLDCAPERALFIDDRAVNIDAAKLAGLQTVFFQTTEQALSDAMKLCGITTLV